MAAIDAKELTPRLSQMVKSEAIHKMILETTQIKHQQEWKSVVESLHSPLLQ